LNTIGLVRYFGGDFASLSSYMEDLLDLYIVNEYGD